MTGAAQVRAEALVALVTGLGLLLLSTLGPGPLLSLFGAGLALATAVAWWATGRPVLLYLATGLATLPLLVALELPASVGTRLTLGLGVALVVAFLELGDLVERFRDTDLASEHGGEAFGAIHRRLLQVLGVTTVLLLVALTLPLIMTPLVAPWVGDSVEWHGAWGVLGMALMLSLGALVVARLRRDRAERPDPASP